MIKRKFSVDFNDVKIIGDIISLNNQPELMCLHGGGPMGRTSFDGLRELLFQKGISSCSFDFLGHGETGGDIQISSLKQRTDQSLAVIDALNLPQPFSIIASSMGGYTAIKLTESRDVDNLILIAPAVYASSAYKLPFGWRFSKAIRERDSWKKSDAWSIIQKYSGNLLIFAAEKDQIIPYEVIESIYDSAEMAKTKEIIIVKEATHSLIKWLNEHSFDMLSAARRISDLILNT